MPTFGNVGILTITTFVIVFSYTLKHELKGGFIDHIKDITIAMSSAVYEQIIN